MGRELRRLKKQQQGKQLVAQNAAYVKWQKKRTSRVRKAVIIVSCVALALGGIALWL